MQRGQMMMTSVYRLATGRSGHFRLARRCMSYFELFPKTFREDITKGDFGFTVDAKGLRKEYRKLQSTNHPDLNNELNSNGSQKELINSSLINKAYETLSDPLKRAQYIISLNSKLNLDNDEISKKYQFQDKALLMEMMDIHEQLEEIMDEAQLKEMKAQNQSKIEQLCKDLQTDFSNKDWESAAMKAVRLKYCYNIKNALKNWSPGQPVTLTH